MENASYYKRIGIGFFALFLLFTLTACFRNTQPYQADEDYNSVIDERENDQDEVSETDDQDENKQEEIVNGPNNDQTQSPKEYPSIAQEVSWRNYQNNNFGVMPTVKDLENATGYPDPTIRKFGEGYFINKSENTKQLVQKYRQIYPNLNQNDLAIKSNISLRSIKRYFNN